MTNHNLKEVPPAGKPDKMTWDEINKLANRFAQDMSDTDDRTIGMLMLLMREIGEHPFDHSHVEAVVSILTQQLFAWTSASSTLCDEFIKGQRRRLLGEKGGGE